VGGNTMLLEIKDNALLINDSKLCIPNMCFMKEIGNGANAKVFPI